ncbi:hypothetical protein MLP_16900 [Microlunatus phosphovorus NM-1]|uniref:Uncharacterized protein n=1 Tax=Microlunatus phosphovorus (strain ATCC 700054 / DSM 10555 / JCM 9379 / NBRC 101784 / NCIMB 13414 / VKM Ac-1990 / NM-1) TaxID=1032480 RepID=F5XRL4_MICPN|nr:hypothetical protein [Microlunatus phosphovorus]BAK34704.1 hypothetical protein MLP_16900 [Microlunatus phosphovorus NM-1]
MKRLTISVSDEIAEKARRAVESGNAESVSAYFGELAEREPDWVAAREAVDEMIVDIGGIPDEARAWARQTLGML